MIKLHRFTHHDAVRITSVCDDLEIPVLIEDSGYKGRHLFLSFYEERMEKLFLYREEGTSTSYRKLFRDQVENMERAVLNGEQYQPFLVR